MADRQPLQMRPLQVIQNKVNLVSGYVVSFGFLAGFVILDPFQVFVTWPAGQALSESETLGYGAFFGCLSMLALATLGRPRVELHADHLLIRNVLHDVLIPLSALDSKEDLSDPFLISARNRTYTAWGAERAPFPLRPPPEGMRMRDAGGGLVEHCSSVGVFWRRPERAEITLAALWSGVLLVGLLLGRL